VITLRTAARVVLLGALTALTCAHAAVQVLTGPTPIPDGDARAAGDLTVINEKLAFALAIESAVPFGVPRGAIVDLAPVSHGHIGRDRVAFADFIPNNWSAWPNTYQHLDVLERGPQQVRIRTVRDWGKVNIVTVYSLAANSDQLEIRTTMTNGGDETLTGLLSGLTLWPRSGFLFPVPGLAGVSEGQADGALADRVVAYDAGWAITLHAPYLDHIGSASRDLFQLHTLQPHESRTFTGWLQVGASGDLAPVVRAEIERRQLPSGTVRGAVSIRDGKALGQRPRRHRAGARLPRPGQSRPPRLLGRRCPQRRGAGRAHRHHRGPKAAGRVSRWQAFFHATRAQGPRGPADCARQLSFHRVSGRRLPGAGRAGAAHGCRRSGYTTPGRHHAAVRSPLARLVLRRSAPPRGSGRGGDTAGGSGALAARGGTRSAVRQRSRFDRESPSVAADCQRPWRVVHPGDRAVAVLGPLQCLSAYRRCAAGDRHQHGHHRHDPEGGATQRRHRGAGQSPIQSLRLLRQPQGRRGTRRRRSGV